MAFANNMRFAGNITLSPWEGEESPPNSVALWVSTLPLNDLQANPIGGHEAALYVENWNGHAITQQVTIDFPRSQIARVAQQVETALVDCDITWGNPENAENTVHRYMQFSWNPELIRNNAIPSVFQLTLEMHVPDPIEEEVPHLGAINVAGNPLIVNEHHD